MQTLIDACAALLIHEAGKGLEAVDPDTATDALHVTLLYLIAAAYGIGLTMVIPAVWLYSKLHPRMLTVPDIEVREDRRKDAA